MDAAGRWQILRLHVEDQIPLAALARDTGVGLRTLERWHARFRTEGYTGLGTRRRADAGSHRLLGYCVLQQESSLTATLLQEQLAQQVPEYMVPTALRILDRWPMTVNGKIDKKALPPIEIAVRASGRAARTPEEMLVCQGVIESH